MKRQGKKRNDVWRNCLSLAFDWLKEWREISKPITGHSEKRVRKRNGIKKKKNKITETLNVDNKSLIIIYVDIVRSAFYTSLFVLTYTINYTGSCEQLLKTSPKPSRNTIRNYRLFQTQSRCNIPALWLWQTWAFCTRSNASSAVD